MYSLLAFWILIGGFVGCFCQMLYASAWDEELSFETAFWFAKMFYINNEDHLNLAGLIIVIVILQLLILPGSILTVFIVSLQKILCKLWDGYKHIFRKRE